MEEEEKGEAKKTKEPEEPEEMEEDEISGSIFSFFFSFSFYLFIVLFYSFLPLLLFFLPQRCCCFSFYLRSVQSQQQLPSTGQPLLVFDGIILAAICGHWIRFLH